MNFETFKKIKQDLNRDQWIHNEESDTYIYKEDFSLSIKVEHTNTEFNEEWATNHPDKNAKQSLVTFQHSGNDIEVIRCASIDGGRCTLPYPKPIQKEGQEPTFEYTSEHLNLARFISPENADEYISRAKIVVKD